MATSDVPGRVEEARGHSMSSNGTTAVRDSAQDRRRSREDRGVTGSAAARPDRLPPPPRERRPALAALAVLLIVGGAVTAGLLALRADERVPVMVATRDIAVGERITEEALSTTPVASEGTLLIPASQAAVLSGQHARVAISAGQLLDTSMLTSSALLQPGSVAVGAALATGRVPASGLQAGDVVRLVRVAGAEGTVIVDDAIVSSSYGQGSDAVGGQGGSTVTLIVGESDAAEVAAVAAAGELSIVLVQRGAAVGGED